MNFILITVSGFFLFCNFSSFFLLPVFISGLGGDEAQIGYVMGSFGITSLLCLPFISTLADRHGRKVFMTAGALAMTAASVCFVFVQEVGYAVFALRLIQGAAFASFYTAALTMVSDIAETNRLSERLGIFGGITMLSYAAGPTVGEWIMNTHGDDGLFVYASFFSLAAFVTALFVRENNFTPQEDKTSFGKFFKLFAEKKYGIIFLTNLAMAVGLGSMLNFFAVFAHENRFEASRFFLTYALTIISVRIFFSKFADRIGRKTVASPAIFLAATALVLISQARSEAQIILLCFLFSAGYGLMFPTLGAMVREKTQNGTAKAMGAFNSSFSLGINYAAFPLGIVAERAGLRTMYVLAGLVVFTGFAVFQIFERKTAGESET
ncbi:MAG: MFS transporter [Candidatus Mycalebacterium zealandia]|nr:MAG: MFS transporter [Candidatus Mycalebacterium zealandia]